MHAVAGGVAHGTDAGAAAEAPAVLDLLLHRWGPTAAAPAATLLDLAARGHLELVAGASGELTARLPAAAPPAPPARFEAMLLRQAAGRLAGGSAPAQALLPYPRDEGGARWYAAFRAAVLEEARSLGLVRDRRLVLGRRLTAAGRAAAARWRAARPAAAPPWPPAPGAVLDDRAVARGVALGAASAARRSVTPPTGRVWSPAGGRWHLARVPVRPRGQARRRARAHPERVAGRGAVAGIVVRRWTVDMSTEYASGTYHNVAVDDGSTTRAWHVPPDDYARVATGAAVRVTVDRRGRFVALDLVPPGDADGAPAPEPPSGLGTPEGTGRLALGAGVVALLLCWLPVAGIAAGNAGLIAGIRGLGTSSHRRAVAGIVTSSLAIAANVAVCVLVALGTV